MDTSQESENFETDVADEVTPGAETTSSPDVTEESGTSSSDVAVEEQEQAETADAIRDAFLKEYGDPAEEDEEPSTKEETQETSDAETERKEAPEAEKDDGDDEFRISDDEFKALPEGARKRIGHLNARAKKAERQIQEMQQEVETSRQAQERVSQLETFVTENNIEPENMARAFAMTAKLAQGDYQGFLQDIQPFVDYAQQAIGQALPQDLQSQVDDGYITEEAARDLVKTRHQAQRSQAEAERLRQQQAQHQQQTQQQQAVQNIQTAVDQRESEIKASDPDYARIQEAVQRNMRFALESGAVPRTPEQAVQMVNRAYEMAKQQVPQAPKPATPRRPTATTVARGAQAPASTKDAIIGALEGYTPS